MLRRILRHTVATNIPRLSTMAKQCLWLIACALAASSAQATTFNLDGVAAGTGTPLTLTSDGISATLSSAADPGGFDIALSFFSFTSGNVILTPGPAGACCLALDIKFSQTMTSFSAPFGTDGLGPLALLAELSGASIGGTTAVGMVTGDFNFPEGTISFSGAAFDQIVLSDSTDPYFAIGSFAAAGPTNVPEPNTLALFGLGLVGVGLSRRRLAR